MEDEHQQGIIGDASMIESQRKAQKMTSSKDMSKSQGCILISLCSTTPQESFALLIFLCRNISYSTNPETMT